MPWKEFKIMDQREHFVLDWPASLNFPRQPACMPRCSYTTTRSTPGCPTNNSPTVGRTKREISESGKARRIVSKAGTHIIASPTQFGPQTRTFFILSDWISNACTVMVPGTFDLYFRQPVTKPIMLFPIDSGHPKTSTQGKGQREA